MARDDDGDDRLEPLLGLIDAIGDKIEAASKMIEAPIPELKNERN